MSLDGMSVRRVKQWILRCAACFKTCTEMGRLFCPVCGNASLDRVSCSVNAKTGATYLHLRRNHKVNLRGSKFSIPAPDPTKGRFEGDLLLREDQLLTGIWAQKVLCGYVPLFLICLVGGEERGTRSRRLLAAVNIIVLAL